MGAQQSNGGGQAVPRTPTGTLASPAARRRGRDVAKAFYLVFGDPRIRYTGEGRGPLIFHVFSSAANRTEDVAAADTMQCPVALKSVKLERGTDTVDFVVSVSCEAECTAELVVGGSLDVHRRVELSGSETQVAVDLEFAEGRKSAVGRARVPRDVFQRHMSTTTAAPSLAATTGPSAFCLCISFQMTSPTMEDVSPPPCCIYYGLRATERGGEATIVTTLLQRGESVFKIDSVFDLGGDANVKPAKSSQQQQGGGEGGSDDDKREDEDDDEGDMDALCVVCIENPKNTVVLPCRHLCMCSECAQAVRNQRGKCPICRGEIDKLMKRADG